MTPFVKALPNTRQLLEKAEERIQRLKAINTALVILLICTTALGFVQYARLVILQQEVAEGNQTSCDEGYVAKIVDGSKVTCVMMRVGPAMVTHKQVIKDNGPILKRVSLIKEENKNENRSENCSSYSFLDNWNFDGRMRKSAVCSDTARSSQQRSRCRMQTGGSESHGECRNRFGGFAIPSLRYDSQ